MTDQSIFFVRHGESFPNVKGEIVSLPENGVKRDNGLTQKGREQALQAGENLHHMLISPRRVVLITSDFSRAVQTALGMFEVLVANGHDVQCITDIRLRERYFGNLEGQSNRYYDDVWAIDGASKPGEKSCGDFNSQHGVESVFDCAARGSQVIERARAYLGENAVVVLVSHGDMLQILQARLEGMSETCHRSMKHMSNCELRKVNV